MPTVNSNTAAMFALNKMNASERDMTTAMERLSSGKRINHAGDDAAAAALLACWPAGLLPVACWPPLLPADCCLCGQLRSRIAYHTHKRCPTTSQICMNQTESGR